MSESYEDARAQEELERGWFKEDIACSEAMLQDLVIKRASLQAQVDRATAEIEALVGHIAQDEAILAGR